MFVMNQLSPSGSQRSWGGTGVHTQRGRARGPHSSCWPFSPSPRVHPGVEGTGQLPGILSEGCPLVPIWETKQGDGAKQPLLFLLLAPKQVLSL